ncbi:MAG: hypothetical protein H0X37_27535 [Herpetosiphonaceae bacterium]|nr:hypothetical protein [Herpetosiphonaceae bacterium]
MPDIMSDPFMADPTANRVGQAELIEGMGGEGDAWANYSDDEIRNFVTEAGTDTVPTEATAFRARLADEAKRRGITVDSLG